MRRAAKTCGICGGSFFQKQGNTTSGEGSPNPERTGRGDLGHVSARFHSFGVKPAARRRTELSEHALAFLLRRCDGQGGVVLRVSVLYTEHQAIGKPAELFVSFIANAAYLS